MEKSAQLNIDEKSLKSLMILASVVETRDKYTGGHLWRVGQFAKTLGEKAGLSPSEVFVVTAGGILHDLGKVGIPDAILNKPGRLTHDEYEIIKTHPVVGRDLLREHPLAPLALDAVAQHHERCDGTGYPDGLDGEETSLSARIVSIVDAFDAMTSTRSYRRGMPVEKAIAILRENRQTQFDGELVDHFLDLSRQGKLKPIIGHSDHECHLVNCPKCGPILAVPKTVRDGSRIVCRACRGEYLLHVNGDTFDAELKGTAAAPKELQTPPDVEPLNDLLGRIPKNAVTPP
ncbi:MAG: HD-GYP domain-containing protein [Nitrospinales bacterium]